jgi:hypothetical protein
MKSQQDILYSKAVGAFTIILVVLELTRICAKVRTPGFPGFLLGEVWWRDPRRWLYGL